MSDETKASATVSDYLRWRGDLTFAQDGFNEVDNLLLCIISYIKLENCAASTLRTPCPWETCAAC